MKTQIQLYASECVGLAGVTIFTASLLLLLSGQYFLTDILMVLMVTSIPVMAIGYAFFTKARKVLLKQRYDEYRAFARHLIVTKQYGRAKKALQVIQDDPIAQNWLWRLEHLK